MAEHIGSCRAERLLRRRVFPVNLEHFRRLNDEVGVIQYAPRSKPDLTWGYTTDDVARALVLVSRASAVIEEPERRTLARRYIAFLEKMRAPDGRWSNQMNSDGSIADLPSDKDHLGRAAWAAACYTNSGISDEPEWGRMILETGLQWALDTTSPRAKAYFLLGTAEFLKSEPNPVLRDGSAKLARQISGWFRSVSRPGWSWFEDILTYDNARLPESLAAYHEIGGDSTCLVVASESVAFLMSAQTVEGMFAPVGNRGWYRLGEHRALYDQQPVDAGATVEACNRLYRVTGERRYAEWSSLALSWYYGNNLKGRALYDEKTGGCYDGLMQDGVNLNQGAESVLSYLLAATSFNEPFSPQL